MKESDDSIHFSRAKGPANPPSGIGLNDGEIIVDLFAGGGGWSLGIEWALGRSPDVAVNHDSEALAMHKANHRQTVHYQEDIYDVDPIAVCQGRPVGLLVLSPDCTEHSRAKNGAIVRDKKIRGLAWTAIDWARAVRPRIIVLENVSEWWDWGPLDEDGKIDKGRKGEFREFWWRRLEAMGYRISKRIIKACDHGAPTSRQRLFVIARCDGIDPEQCWPEATHGPGRAQPYRTAAECIDYTIPCPSIFMTKRQAKKFSKATGIRCKRPLADKTMQRIRRGIFKYVINCAKPFTVRLTGPDDRVYDIDEPVRTVTGANRGEFALVTPTLTQTAFGEGKGKTKRRGAGAHDIQQPMPTTMTSRGVALVSPLVTPVKTWGGGGNNAAPANRPMRTVTTSKRGEYAVVAPTLVQTGYGERKGQAPRCLDLHTPLGTIMSGGKGGNGKHALVAAFLSKGYSEPDGKKYKGGWNGGQDLRTPMSSITTRDHHNLTVSHLIKMRGTSDAHMDASSANTNEPLHTVSAGGNHHGEVRAFLQRYNGDTPGAERVAELDAPLTTADTSRRFGLVMVEGEPYEIADIGMRMLEPRELFRAQGFPDSYIIDPIVTRRLKNGRVVTGPLTETAQIEKCGNSVCPQVAEAIIRSVVSARAMREVA